MTETNLKLFFLATLFAIKDSAVEAFKDLLKNWIIIPGTILAFYLFSLIVPFFSALGIAGGFIAGFIYVALISMYYLWLSRTLRGEKLNWRDLKDFDQGLFWSFISVGFIFWILSYLFRPLGQMPDTLWAFGCFKLALFLLFNPIPEIVYIQRSESLYALKESFDFVKRNWIEWFIPLVILFSPLLILNPYFVLTSIAGANPFTAAAEPLLPPLLIFSLTRLTLDIQLGGLEVIAIIFSLAITNWFMLFRGHFFQALESGTRRKRIYEMKNR